MIIESTRSEISRKYDPILERTSLYESLVEGSEDAILSMDLNHKIKYLNHAAERMFEYPREEILGQSVFQLVPLGRGGDLQAKLKRVREGERIEHYETQRIKKDGTKFNVSLTLSSLRNDLDEVIGFSWIVRDISKQKESEVLLRKLSCVVQQTADAVMISDAQGKLEYVNPAFVTTTGYSEKEVLGHTAKVLKSGKHSRLFYKKMWSTILGGKPFRATMVNKRKDGALFYTEKTITPISVTSDQISHFVSTDKDVTEQKLAEERSREIQQRFAGLFNFATDGMVYCALDGTIIEVNEAFCKLTGYSREELVNRATYHQITTPEYWGKGAEMLKRIINTGESFSYERLYATKEGNTIPVLVTAFPVKNGNSNAVVAVGGIAKDISDIKKQQKQLEAVTAELARSNRDLEQFASIASHDLQEPLRTISSYLQLIEKKNSMEGDSKEYLNFAVNGAKRLRDLITDLLSYSRAGNGRREMRKVDCALSVSEALLGLREAVEANHAKIEIGDLPTVQADANGITQLFQNLIGNAIKYHSKQPPVVQVTSYKAKGEWVFKVTDNGIGIPKEHAAKVFEMFRRLHSRSEFPGTGIGLAICKKIVEQRGGKIWVESIPEKGSSFFFTIPDELPCV